MKEVWKTRQERNHTAGARGLAAFGAALVLAGCASSSPRIKLDTHLHDQKFGKGDMKFAFPSSGKRITSASKLIIGLEVACPSTKGNINISATIPELGISYTDYTCNQTQTEPINIDAQDRSVVGGVLHVKVSASEPDLRYAIGKGFSNS